MEFLVGIPFVGRIGPCPVESKSWIPIWFRKSCRRWAAKEAKKAGKKERKCGRKPSLLSNGARLREKQQRLGGSKQRKSIETAYLWTGPLKCVFKLPLIACSLPKR